MFYITYLFSFKKILQIEYNEIHNSMDLSWKIRVYGGSFLRCIKYTMYFGTQIAFKLFINDWKRFTAKSSKQQYKAYEEQHNIIETYLIEQGYLKLMQHVLSTNNPTNDVEQNEPIWVCWWQGEDGMPEIIKICYNNICRNAGKHTVHLITLDNYYKYINIPEAIIKKFKSGNIKFAHLADLLRLKLLRQYGGLWLDATIFVNENIDNTIFNYPFYSLKNPAKDNLSVSEFRWATFCMASKPNNPFIIAVEQAFETALIKQKRIIHYLLIDYFIDLLYKNDKSCKQQIDNIPQSNLYLHDFAPNLNKKFEQTIWNKWTSNTKMFKLTYKQKFHKKNQDGTLTFYGYLTSTYT